MASISEPQPHSRSPSGFGMAGWTLFSSVLLLAACLVLVYFPIFSVESADDLFFRQTDDGTYGLALASYVNGRFIPGGVFQFVSATGNEIHAYWTAIQLIAFLAVACFSVLFVDRMNVPLSWIETFALSGVIAAFPYMLNLLANKNNAVNATIAYACVSAAIYCFSALKGKWRIVLTTIFLFACIASYQTTIYYFIVFVVGYQLVHGGGMGRNKIAAEIGRGALCCLAAVFLYFLIHKIVVGWALAEMGASGNPELVKYYGKSRSELNDLAGLGESTVLHLVFVARTLFSPEPIFPLPLKIFAAVVFLFSYHFWTKPVDPDSAHTSVRYPFFDRDRRFLLLALILAIGSPIHLAITDNWLAPRVLAHAGAVWAVLLISALIYAPDKWRRGLSISCALFTLGLAYATNAAVRDIAILYDRDLKLAQTIVEEMEDQAGYDDAQPVAVVGVLGSGSNYMSETWSYFNLSVSKFGDDWSKRVVLEQAAGHAMPLPSPEFQLKADETCNAMDLVHPFYEIALLPQGVTICLRNDDAKGG